MTAAPAHLTIQCKVHFRQVQHGRKRMTVGDQPEKTPQPPGRVPRISRLMALAIRFEELLQQGQVKDYADIARLGHVTRARATQIMSLLNLAPDIQEAILFLPPTVAGRDAIKEWQVRPIVACAEWRKQRGMWRRLLASANTNPTVGRTTPPSTARTNSTSGVAAPSQEQCPLLP